MAKTISDKDRAKNLGISVDLYKRAQTQCKSEITESFAFMQPKWEIWKPRVKIYNNQKKDPSAVSDPMLFTHFQTIQAALYEDKLNVDFTPRTRGDVERTENLNPLYIYDTVNMEKAIIDYKWNWNTLFFGHALCIMSQWNSKLKCPTPEVVNMLTWHRDPNATSVNGDSEGRGAMRFGGRPIAMTKEDFKNNSAYKNVAEITDVHDQEMEEAQRIIDEAQGYTSSDNVEGDNKNYTIMEWYTKINVDEVDKDGNKKKTMKRVLIGIQNELIVRFTILKDQDEWGIVDKMIYPDALSWDGVSVPDLIEDKQRANARVLNASLFNVESNAHQMGIYDSTKITKSSYLNFGFNKNIPVAGDITGAYQPIQRPQVGQEVNYLMETLKDLAQRATGASEMQQGAISGSKRTATENALVSEGADTRFSLSAKIFGWGERAFARYWYKMYKMHYTKTIDEKVVRVNGLIGYFWKPLKREDIIGDADPDVKVESKMVSEARRLSELQNFTNFYPIFSADPTVNKEFLSREAARLNGYNSVQMSMLFKADPDRIIAKEENEKLAKGEYVEVQKTDDDYKHVDEHQKEDKAKDHIQSHFEAIVFKAKSPSPAVREEVERMNQTQEVTPDTTNLNFNTPKSIQTA